MSTKKKGILAEALADSKALKSAAMSNAQAMILESMKGSLKEMVEEQMNEMADESEEGCEPEGSEEELSEGSDMEINENDELSLDELDSDDEAEEETSEGEDDDLAGLSEADLQEALAAALNEVDSGKLGDLRPVGVDDHEDPVTGADSKEAGWEEKTAPAKKDFTVKENAYKSRIAKLATENAVLKKANGKLKLAVNEVHLFNNKLHYAHKLLNKEGLSLSVKRAILAKMDATKSVAEAKNLYESLQLALGTLSEQKKPVKKQASLSEALGIHGTSGKNVSQVRDPIPTDGSAIDVHRLQVLAGLKK